MTGLTFERFFTKGLIGDVWSTVEWIVKDVTIDGSNFTLRDVVVPATYSDTAVRIVASRYLRQRLDGLGRPSVRTLIEQVVDTFADWGWKEGYFAHEDDRAIFQDELTYILLHQYAAFNSPVWFNFGVEGCRQQGSACFINPVFDTMEGWCDLQRREALIFKGGSGAGMNISPIRSSWEHLSGGGEATGPIPLMKGLDSYATMIKSGGKNRRAAKMVVMNVEHPDILEQKNGQPGFITCKAEAELFAHHLIDTGFDAMFNVAGGAYDRVPFQAANHSVNVPDLFMEAVQNDGRSVTRAITTGKVIRDYPARQIMNEICQAAWLCGDPGLQYRDTINSWNTCPNSFYIWGSNPCSEYVWDTDTSCNLVSIRLTRFLLDYRDGDGSFGGWAFDTDAFFHVVRLLITAMEIQVGRADYPTEMIAEKTKKFRTLGIGPTDLGALLMKLGLPYDSPEGRGVAASVQSLMTAIAYGTSAEISRDCGGPFEEFARNQNEMLGIIRRHLAEHHAVETHPAGISVRHPIAATLHDLAIWWWEYATANGERYGFRNAQVSLAAPAGTISFLMDADTTGIEPDIALLKYKTLVGGGVMRYLNRALEDALLCLDYTPDQVAGLLRYVEEKGHFEGSDLKPEHLPVFDCAFAAEGSNRVITPEGHVRMLAALQPFFSMAMSKTVNMPNSATPADFKRMFFMAWEMGVKCIALYRDGCKRSQPLSTSPAAKMAKAAVTAYDLVHVAQEEVRLDRKRLPDERNSITHKFTIGGFEGYLTVGMYEDGSPGEMFIICNKQGSTINGLLDAFATSISLGLQYGIPLHVFIDKYKNTRFEPAGFTNNEYIRIAKSVIDYVFRWVERRFLTTPETLTPAGNEPIAAMAPVDMSGPPCHNCGSIMQPSGSCFVCPTCAETSGCS